MNKIIRLISIILVFLCVSCVSGKVKSDDAPKADAKKWEYSGIVVKMTEFAGTLSEYSYYILGNPEKKEILFNSITYSEGFDKYVNKKVQINGVRGIGSVGWKKIKKSGIIVQEIQITE